MVKMMKLMLAAMVLLGWQQAEAANENRNGNAAPPDTTCKAVCKAPPFLKRGDKVALVSPSSFVATEEVEAAAEVIRGWGLTPVIGPNVGKQAGLKEAGTLAERISDLRWALEDSDVKAIICNRGGYGTIQMVPFLSTAELAAHPKWLAGFSDITTLHTMEVSAGVMSIHGTMSRFIGRSEGKDSTSLLLRDLLFGKVPSYQLPPHTYNQSGKATATLVGGNLCTFFPLIGSEVDPTRMAEGFILFVEEVGESYHNIDRLINMLILNGTMDRCKGVILGEFTGCERDLDYESVEQLFRKYLSAYDIPVACGFPGGHGDVNLPLLMGAPCTLEVTQDGARIEFGT